MEGLATISLPKGPKVASAPELRRGEPAAGHRGLGAAAPGGERQGLGHAPHFAEPRGREAAPTSDGCETQKSQQLNVPR